MGNRHNVFISYHHANDEEYKREFERLFCGIYDILETKAVSDGDIDIGLPTETVRQKIRDEFIRSATVTVVLIGAETWKRKHVDWEISASIRDTRSNRRTGLIGIALPTCRRDFYGQVDKGSIPPRLYDNVQCGFATIHDWSNNPYEVQQWLHKAFIRRNTVNPNNSYQAFGKNRTTDRWKL